MAVSISPLADSIGVEVRGLDVGRVTDAERRQLFRAFLDHGLVLLRNTPMTLQQQIDFSRIFGDTELHPAEAVRHPDAPEIIILRNSPVDADDPEADETGLQLPWHSDLIYTQNPSHGAVLCPVELPPEGGDTGWIDTVRVYAELPDAMKRRIDGLRIVHSQMASRRRDAWGEIKANARPQGYAKDKYQLPDVVHPLVYVQPGTGEPTLNVNPMFAEKILDIPEKEGEELLAELQQFATQDRFAYVHRWKLGDVMIWNNLRTMHRAFGCKNKFSRIVHRTTIAGIGKPLEPYRLESQAVTA